MSNYNVKTRVQSALPRSSRLREGAASDTSGSSAGAQAANGQVDGHSHTNKSDLDRLRVAGQYVKVYVDVEQSGETIKNLVPAKAGYADTAGDAAHADEADTAEQWDGHQFADWINQPVKSTSEVAFPKVTSADVESSGFASGALGSGFRLINDAGGSSLEVDRVTVRRSMKVYELIIQQLKHQGGTVIHSAASMEISTVEAVTGGYKCSFDTEEGQIPNEFTVGDQARCQRFALGTTSAKYYWRLVTAVGADHVVLSASDCDAGSGIPAAGDVIVQLGHRTNRQRQAAKITVATGNDTPRDEYYRSIDSYSLAGKLVTVIGVRNGEVGVYTDAGSFRGKVAIGAGSTGLASLSEWPGQAARITGAEGMLADINGDDVLDISEKAALRKEWVAINGVESTGMTSAAGSYYTARQHGLKTAANVRNLIFDGKSIACGGMVITFGLTGVGTLDAAYVELRDYLVSVGINDRMSVTRNFDRAAANAKLRNYHDAEDAVYVCHDDESRTLIAAAADSAREDLARKLGYASWAAMVAAATAGNTIISGGYLRNQLIDTDTLVAKHMLTRDGKVEILADGSIKAVDGHFSGTLDGVSGTFRELNCVDRQGNVTGSLKFGDGTVDIYGDIYHQALNGKSRFYAAALWCRSASFGAVARNAVLVDGSCAHYCLDGLNSASNRVTVNLESRTDDNGHTYYTIPLFGRTGAIAGFPVETVVFKAPRSATYYYLLDSVIGQKFTVINACNTYSNIYFYRCGYLQGLAGGCAYQLVNVGAANQEPSHSYLGSGLMIVGSYDNDWS